MARASGLEHEKRRERD